jgi:hypothetical protein
VSPDTKASTKIFFIRQKRHYYHHYSSSKIYLDFHTWKMFSIVLQLFRALSSCLIIITEDILVMSLIVPTITQKEIALVAVPQTV